jgi:hypothetical protein
MRNCRKDLSYLQAMIVEIPINLIIKIGRINKEIEIKKYVYFKKPLKLAVDFLKEIQKIYLKIFARPIQILWIKLQIKGHRNGISPCET